MSIEEYLTDVFEDFRDDIEDGLCLCDLKKLSFEFGNLPEYEDVQTQRLYLLRYAFAYAYEYADMYARLLRQMKDPREISVVSFGCGTMLDYWSLVYAIKEIRDIRCRVDYSGIDLIEWDYQFPPRRRDELHFYLQNINEFFDDEDTLNSDVYFFPKSISEFSEDEMATILDGFENKNIEKDIFYVCVSLRKKDEPSDEERTAAIMEAIERNGFRACAQPQGYKEKAVWSYDHNFNYPGAALSYLKNLNERCLQFREEGENCYDNCECLNRQPILKTNFLYNYIIKFERI